MSPLSSARVLVVARKDPQEPIGGALKGAGYSVVWADGGSVAARSLEHARPDIVVLDGHSSVKETTKNLIALAAKHGLPLLIVHSQQEPTHAELGSSAGLPVHFCDLPSLIQQVEALTGQRLAKGGEVTELAAGELVVELTSHTAHICDKPLDLTPREFDLLCHFMRRPGWIWSRQQLLELIWGYDFVDARVVTVHIGNLRRKLEAASPGARFIDTVRNVGYRFVENRPQESRRARVSGSRPGGWRPSDRTPFVGRDLELAALQRAFANAVEGQVRIAALFGDLGIGKTRLAEEFAARAREVGAGIYWGRCRQSPRQPAYEPWVEILSEWEREDSRGHFASVFTLETPQLSFWSADGESARSQLFERLTDAIRDRARGAALGLILEDLHWAHTSTLLALQHVVRHLREVPVMLLLTYRPTGAPNASVMADVVADVVRSDSGLILPLGPLSKNEVQRLIRLTRHAKASDELVADVHRETEGNPLFLSQLVRLLSLTDRYPETPPADLHLAREEGVRRVILQNLSGLSQACRRCLDAASVVGRDFRVAVVAEAVGLSVKTATGLFAEAAASRTIIALEGEPDRYRFAHHLFQEILYCEISPQTRARLHARIATVLERCRADELDLYSAELAHHYSAGVPAACAEKAVDFCLRAGRVAASQCAWEEASSQWRRGLEMHELLPADCLRRDRSSLARVHEDLAEAYSFAGDTERAVEAYQQAALRTPPEDAVWRARLRRKQSSVLAMSGLPAHAAAVLAEAAMLLGPPRENAELDWWQEWLEVKLEQAWLDFYAAEVEEMEALIRSITEPVQARAIPEEKAKFDDLVLVADYRRRRFVATSETLELALKCAESHRAIGSPKDLLLAQALLAITYLLSPTERENSHIYLIRYREIARQYRDITHQLAALWGLAFYCRSHGEVDGVRGYSMETLALTRGRRIIWYGAQAQGGLSWAAARNGDMHAARTLANAGLHELEASYPRCPFEWHVRWPLLGLAAADGDWEAAARQAVAMVHASQQRMPDQLDEMLCRLGEDQPPGPPSGAEKLAELCAFARSHGYL